jgi:ribonuclease D
MEREGQAQKKERPKAAWRSEHRSRAHQSAHADPALVEQAVVPPGLAGVPSGPAAVVTDDQALTELIAELRTTGSFAYDSEFIGELTYFPHLCLIQVASEARVALIDPLADLDLRPFWELIADPGVEKIVHAGEQDLEPVYRHVGKLAANVVDTQISAGFIGLPYPLSLAKIVQELTGVRLGKGLTFSHWDQRPLSAIQLRYAADDVRYLPAVWSELRRRLDAAGHTAWAREESATLCANSAQRFDPDTQYLRIKGASSLSPRNLAVMRELTIWRDAAARQQDVPPRTLLRDEVMLDLARTPVKSVDKLARVRGLPRPVEHEHGQHLVELTTRAMGLPPAALPTAARDAEPTPPERFRGDALFAAAQALCAGLSIDPGLVTSRQDFADFYRHLSTDARRAGPSGDLPKLMRGWRKQAVGDRLVALLDGRSQIVLQWTGQQGLKASFVDV